MKQKNYGKDISSVNTPVMFHLSDGSTQYFPNSQKAQAWFDQNYSDRHSLTDYIPTQGDSKHPIELNEITVTANAPNKPKNTQIRRGIDMYIGANYSPRFNAAYTKLGMNPLNWPKYIPKSYWDSDTHKAINEGSNIVAGVIAAPFLAYSAAQTLPWLAKTAPYLSARGWLGATQAAGNTPAWLTPTSATAIDAALAGGATGMSVNDMTQNGPNVGNVIGTTLGTVGLGVEAAPTVTEGYNTVRNIITPIINLKNKNNRQAISDLFAYIKNGQYKNTFSINPETNQISWSIKLPEGNVPFVQEAIKRGHPRNGRAGNFYISTDQGTITFNPELQSTIYTSKMPEQYGGWGETYLGTVNGKTNRMVLTAPRTDQGGTNLNLPATLPKDLMKDFWITGRAITKPGTYISGDEGIYPLGQRAIQTYRESGFWPAIKTALQTENHPYRLRIGLSPDSYSSIIRQAQREGSELRWGEGFYNWNPSAAENKAIYDAFNNYKKGLITLQDYEKIFNDWVIPLGGRPLQFTTNSYGQVLPIHPHPYIYIKRKGGKIK